MRHLYFRRTKVRVLNKLLSVGAEKTNNAHLSKRTRGSFTDRVDELKERGGEGATPSPYN